jgi:hypothetical protein
MLINDFDHWIKEADHDIKEAYESLNNVRICLANSKYDDVAKKEIDKYCVNLGVMIRYIESTFEVKK